MAIGLMISIPGATQEQYDQIVEGVGDPRLGEGQISHLAGPSADGWCVVDTWESRADFDRFMAERLGEHLQRVGAAQPQITEFDVYREDRR
jgi:hypothetical protein